MQRYNNTINRTTAALSGDSVDVRVVTVRGRAPSTPTITTRPDPARLRRAELGAFLRARRAALTPEGVGLSRGRRRLTPGLRREEVAELGDVGVTWYTWLEQGRAINVSSATLHRIAGALALPASDEAYLFTLAGLAPLPASTHAKPVDPSIFHGVVDGFMSGPAVMFSHAFDVLRYNALWRLLYASDDYQGPFSNNHVYRCFADPARQRLYVDYDEVARTMVGLLRARYAEYVGARDFEALIEALRGVSPEFVRLWHERYVRPLAPFAVRLRHDAVGQVTINASHLTVESTPRVLICFGSPADSSSRRALADALCHLMEEQEHSECQHSLSSDGP